MIIYKISVYICSLTGANTLYYTNTDARSLTFLSRAFEIDFEVFDDFTKTYVENVYFHKRLDVFLKVSRHLSNKGVAGTCISNRNILSYRGYESTVK